MSVLTTYAAHFIETTDTDTAVKTLEFNFSSEHVVTYWIYSWRTNQTFDEQFKRFSDNCQLPTAYSVFTVNRVFRLSTISSNTRSKSVLK